VRPVERSFAANHKVCLYVCGAVCLCLCVCVCVSVVTTQREGGANAASLPLPLSLSLSLSQCEFKQYQAMFPWSILTPGGDPRPPSDSPAGMQAQTCPQCGFSGLTGGGGFPAEVPADFLCPGPGWHLERQRQGPSLAADFPRGSIPPQWKHIREAEAGAPEPDPAKRAVAAGGLHDVAKRLKEAVRLFSGAEEECRSFHNYHHGEVELGLEAGELNAVLTLFQRCFNAVFTLF
jgi:hypothetical protein